MNGVIAKRWKELSGQNKWQGLLHPLDPDLRRYILHYGNMALVCYTAFTKNPFSRYAGNSCYTKEELLNRTGFLKTDPFSYEVTKYIYAASSIKLPECFMANPLSREHWNKESNWFGYVAVATDKGKEMLGRRDIVVAWRGTLRPYEWANDFDFPLESALAVFPRADPKNPPQVANGWLSIYTTADPRSPFDKTSAREQVQGELKRLLEVYKDEEVSITFTGHSLGAVLSIISAADLQYNKYHNIFSPPHGPCSVTAFGFASPRIGDQVFKRLVESLDHLHVLRIENVPDLIPRYPLFRFSDVGEELEINTLKSNLLKPHLLGNYHTLVSYLHGVVGMTKTPREVKRETDQDIAEVNKKLDALENKFLRCVEDKGMEDGTWLFLDDNAKDAEDPPEITSD